METSISQFAAKWYVVEPSVIDEASRSFLHQHALICAGNASPLGDAQVSGSPAVYGDPLMDQLMETIRPTVERVTGLKLWPTYSYVRVYQRGSVLKPHVDRPACEISMTLNLGADAGGQWPIWIAGPAGIASVSLNPGDSVIYRGCDCYHWREPFDGDRLAQVFLHFVDRNGSRAEWRFDKRSCLSRPPAAERTQFL